MFFIGAAFFGLDQVRANPTPTPTATPTATPTPNSTHQVGVMLESPFGTDAADISLLSLGKDLAEDLDVLLTLTRTLDP